MAVNLSLALVRVAIIAASFSAAACFVKASYLACWVASASVTAF